MTLRALIMLCLLGSPLASAAEPSTPSPSPTPTSTPPRMSGLAVAADNPAAAPVVSLSVEPVDAEVTVVWRAVGTDWTTVTTPRTGAFRLARLPDGVQQKGFSFYIEASGGSHSARIGSRSSPIEVPAAVEGNVERFDRDARDDAAFAGPHPAFVMIALGTGIVAGAGAGAFGWDLQIVQSRIAGVEDALASGPSSDERRTLEAERQALDGAALQDTVATAILGSVAGVAIVTGVTLLVMGAMEQ